MTTIIISIILTIILTSLIWFTLLKNQRYTLQSINHKLNMDLQNIGSNVEFQVAQKLNEKLTILNNEIFNLKQQSVQIERESYNRGKNDALESFANEYYVQVYPYKHSYKDEQGLYLFSKRKEFIEVGYQFQLFIKGIPVFQPHIVALETHEKSKFNLNEEAIKELVNIMVAGSVPGGSSFMKVADKVQAKQSASGY